MLHNTKPPLQIKAVHTHFDAIGILKNTQENITAKLGGVGGRQKIKKGTGFSWENKKNHKFQRVSETER